MHTQEPGVSVFIGNEVYAANSSLTHELVSCEDAGYSVSTYREKLLELEKQLKRYPAGFFRKYAQTGTNGSVWKGLRIFLAAGIYNEGGIAPGGCTWRGDGWYNVAVRAEMLGGFNSALHHELWHSADFVMADAGIVACGGAWDKQNPDSFSYNAADYEDYYKHPEYAKWNLKDAANKTLHADEIYFARDYSVVSCEEDSATLIEAVLDSTWHFGSGDKCLGYKYKNGLEMVQAFPHLKAKLDLLSAAAKRLWGYAYWEQMVQ